MFKNLSKILFMMMLMMGTLISISANSWLGVWMGLEINLLSFIPLLTKKNNMNNSEAALNYFLIQAFASTVLLFSMTLSIMLSNIMFFFSWFYDPLMMMVMKMLIVTLMLKIGAAPFHFWFPNVMENISWDNGMILMTWQKLAPMMVLSYILNMNNLLIMFILCSTFIGAIGGLNQNSLRKLLAFSSINHMGWMISAIMFNENLWLIYFFIYSFLNFCIILFMKILQVFYLSQMYSMFISSSMVKTSLLTSLLSLGGLPPFLGFIPKWLVIQALIFMKMNFMNLFLICMSLITLFYYLKISFSSFMMNYDEFNWNFSNYFNNKGYNSILALNFMSLFGFFVIIDLMYLY